MNERDTAILITAGGVLAAWVGFSGAVLRFLRPGMTIYLELAGIAMACAGAAVLARVMRVGRDHTDVDADIDVDVEAEVDDEPEHRHRYSPVVLLLLVPVIAGVVIAPGVLGSWAAARQQGIGWQRSSSFNLASYLRTQQAVGTMPQMEIKDFAYAATTKSDRALLATVPVQLTGFVTHLGGPDGRVAINRFLISCCAADAVDIDVVLDGAPSSLPDNSWVKVTVRFDPDRSPLSPNGDWLAPVAQVHSLQHVHTPSETYEFTYR